MKYYTIKDASKILGISIKTIYYYYYKEKNPEHFVQMLKDGKRILMTTEKFINEYRDKKLSQSQYTKLVSLYYDVVGLVDRVFGYQEDYQKIFEKLVALIRKYDAQGVFEEKPDSRVRAILENLHFRDARKGSALFQIFYKISEELKAAQEVRL